MASSRHCVCDEETPGVLSAPKFLGHEVQDILWLPELGGCSNSLSIVIILTNGKIIYIVMDIKNKVTYLVVVTQYSSFFFGLVHYWFWALLKMLALLDLHSGRFHILFQEIPLYDDKD